MIRPDWWIWWGATPSDHWWVSKALHVFIVSSRWPRSVGVRGVRPLRETVGQTRDAWSAVWRSHQRLRLGEAPRREGQSERATLTLSRWREIANGTFVAFVFKPVACGEMYHLVGLVTVRDQKENYVAASPSY